MATIRGTAGDDTIAPAGNSAGVMGGVPTAGIDTIIGSAGSDRIDGGGGSNLIDYGELTGGVDIVFSLVTGNGTADKGALGTDTLSGGYYRVFGSAFDDSITLTGSPNPFGGSRLFVFIGGAGNDTLDGSSSNSAEVRYLTSPDGVVVDLEAGLAKDGFGDIDLLRGIYGVQGSDYDDRIAGSATSYSETYFAGWGDDRYDGQGGDDTLRYGSASSFNSGVEIRLTAAGSGRVDKPAGRGVDHFTDIDVIDGSGGDDVFIGTRDLAGPTVVFIIGSLGSDRVEGRGSQLNVVRLDSFINSDIDLRSGTALVDGFKNSTLDKVVALRTSFGHDTILGSARDESIEGGSEFGFAIDKPGDSISAGGGSDTLLGMDGDDALYGRKDNDSLVGGLGRDTLYGGGGDDTVIGGAGDDELHGGSGADTFVLAPGPSFLPPGSSVVDQSFGNDTLYIDGADTITVRSNALRFETEQVSTHTTILRFLGPGPVPIETLTLHGDGFDTLTIDVVLL